MSGDFTNIQKERNKWEIPPRIKVHEALGAISDERIQISGNTAEVISSSGNKKYTVEYDPDGKAITANDNGSYWQGYLGYPSIAFLMYKGIIKYNKKVAESLRGIAWKDINQMYKNDFKEVENHIKSLIGEMDTKELDQEVTQVITELIQLKLNKLVSKAKPPKGY